MTIEDIQKICMQFPGMTQDIKWENHLCFNVGGKMFLITAPDEVPVSASFKVNDDDFDLLSGRKGFMPAPYLARYKWIRVDDITLLSPNEWSSYLKKAFEIISAKLPKKKSSASVQKTKSVKSVKAASKKVAKKPVKKAAAKKSARRKSK